MSSSALHNSAEALFWFSDFSRALNFSSAPGVSGNGDSGSRAQSAASHSDVYFWTQFLPFVTNRRPA